MDALQFCYWLQGYFEICNREGILLEPDQVEVIQDHLKLVFNKVTPSRSAIDSVGSTKKLEDLYRIPYCGSMTIKTDNNSRCYWTDRLAAAPVVDYNSMFTYTFPDCIPGESG